MINVDLAVLVGSPGCPALTGLCRAYSFAWARDPTIADNIVNDLPRPISSAKIPPRKSSGVGLLAPVMIC